MSPLPFVLNLYPLQSSSRCVTMGWYPFWNIYFSSLQLGMHKFSLQYKTLDKQIWKKKSGAFPSNPTRFFCNMQLFSANATIFLKIFFLKFATFLGYNNSVLAIVKRIWTHCGLCRADESRKELLWEYYALISIFLFLLLFRLGRPFDLGLFAHKHSVTSWKFKCQPNEGWVFGKKIIK